MGFTTQECEWSKVTVSMLGVKLNALKGFEVTEELDKEYLYGSGSKPIDIVEGNESFPGSLKLLKHEVDKLTLAAQAALYGSILKVPHHLIVITVEFKKSATSPRKTLIVPGVAFTSLKYAQAQGDKFMEVDLPFLAMDLVNVIAGV